MLFKIPVLSAVLYLCFLLLPQRAGAKAIYVDGQYGNDINGGTAWPAAFKTLSKALSVSGNDVTIDSILIAKGTYYPTGAQSGVNRDSAFAILRGGLKLYGGYPNGGGNRNWNIYPTVLSGDIGSMIDSSDNSYHVVVVAGVTAGADSILIDGFTITGAHANVDANYTYGGQVVSRRNGGGLSLRGNGDNRRIGIRNCKIERNLAWYGAGILNHTGSSPTIVNCVISGNLAAREGGAMYNTQNSHPLIANSTLAGNAASLNGGSMYNTAGSVPRIVNTVIFNNNTIVYNDGVVPVYHYSLVQGRADTTNGNLDGLSVSPLFVNPLAATAAPAVGGDYRVQACSPVINAGQDSFVSTMFDLAGDTRIRNKVDIGAYEYPQHSGNLLYVDSSRLVAGDGRSWDNAFTKLSDALVLAHSCLNIDSILIAGGTYYPTGHKAGTNRDSAFAILRGGIKLYGGYPNDGGIRNLSTHKTILSGNINNENSTTDNSYHVMVIAGLSATADSVVIDGVEIFNGLANSSASSRLYNSIVVPSGRGAGIYIGHNAHGGSTVIRNCTVLSNIASNNGGGMYITGASPSIEYCIFKGNSGSVGAGALYIGDSSRAIIKSSVFSLNSSLGIGGGVYCENGARPIFDSCAFTSNSAYSGGAIYSTGSSAPLVSRCVFLQNSVSQSGGAIYSSGATSFISNSVFDRNTGPSGGAITLVANPPVGEEMVRGCSFTGNTATLRGGALYASNTLASLDSNTFMNNAAPAGGALYFSNAATVNISDSRFSYNTADSGGVIGAELAGTITARRCVFDRNSAGMFGGALHFRPGAASYFSNCLFYKNTADVGGVLASKATSSYVFFLSCTIASNVARLGGVVGQQSWRTGGRSAIISNSISWNNSATYSRTAAGEGSISLNSSIVEDTACLAGNSCTNVLYHVDPLFMDTASDNYRLQPCSPAIEYNSQAFFFYNIVDTLDLDRKPRYNRLVDMGAYEYDHSQEHFKTLYVDSANTTPGGGKSWATAVNTLAEALLLAKTCRSIDRILVAKGTYFPTGNRSSTDRDSSFTFFKGSFSIIGGYPGGGGLRDVVANRVILSGDIGVAGDSTDNSYHVMVIPEFFTAQDTVLIDGVTIAHGNAVGTGTKLFYSRDVSRASGGGLAIAYSRAAIIFSNSSFIQNAASDRGGGIHSINSRLTLNDDTLLNNRAQLGGGICMQQYAIASTGSYYAFNSAGGSGGCIYSLSGDVASTGDHFVSNSAGGSGGGIYISSGNVVSTESHYNFNSAGNGSGGGIYFQSGRFESNRDNIVSNSARNAGGGIYCFSGTILSDGTSYRQNAADNGGGIYNSGSLLQLRNARFQKNRAGTSGGAVYNTGLKSEMSGCLLDSNVANGWYGGGVYNYNSTDITVTRSQFRGNYSANFGGALHNESCTINVANTLFSGNRVGNSGGGGAISNSATTMDLHSSTLAGNYTSSQAGALYNMSSSNTRVRSSIIYGTSTPIRNSGATISVTHSIVQGGYTGTGNSSTNPQFVSAPAATTAPFTGGDYRLQFCSPGLNVGDTVGYSGLTGDADVAGNPRYAGRIDRGAYEKQSDVSAGNFSNNVTLTDGSSNGTALVSVCDDAGWTFYATPNSPDSLVFAIQWGSGTSNLTAKNNAEVRIVLDTQHTYVANGANGGLVTMRRYWNVDTKGRSFTNPVSVRFYFNLTDTMAMGAQVNTTGNGIPAVQWFKTTGNAFNPQTQVDGTTINSGNYSVLTPVYGSNNGIAYAQFNGLTSFSGGTAFINMNINPLPLDLIQFSGRLINNQVLLKWQTAHESGTDRFEVERSSDAHNWDSISAVKARGGSANDYELLSEMVLRGDRYYRLRIVASNGTYRYSNVVNIRNDNGAMPTVQIYPNPNAGIFTVTVSGLAEGSTISMLDILGRELYHQPIYDGSHKIALSNLVAGVYSIRVISAGTAYISKVLVE